MNIDMCDCGHAPTPDSFSTGYARTRDGRTLCYDCAADVDRRLVANMTPGDGLKLFAYVKRTPRPFDPQHVDIVTWPGIVLGTGVVYTHARYATRTYVRATIDGRPFGGWTPTQSGDYVVLRALKVQD